MSLLVRCMKMSQGVLESSRSFSQQQHKVESSVGSGEFFSLKRKIKDT